MIRTPRNGSSTSRSLSPVTMKSAFPSTAHSSTMLSFGSRHAWMVFRGWTIKAWRRSSRNAVLMSAGSIPSFGLVRTSASSESTGWERISQKRPLMKDSYRWADEPLPRSAETKTFVSRTTRGAGIPFLPYVLYDLCDVPHRESADGRTASDSTDDGVQLRRPRFLFQLTRQADLFPKGQLPDNGVDINGDRYLHGVTSWFLGYRALKDEVKASDKVVSFF